MVQVIKKKTAQKTADKPPKPITKKRVPVIAKKPAQSVKEEPAQTVAKEEKRSIAKDSARTFALEPVRPMNQPTVSTTAKPASRFSFRTPDGKKESVPDLTQAYPKQTVNTYRKRDKH